MKRPTRKTLAGSMTLAALALAVPPAQAADPSARDIMEKVTVTRKLDGSEAVVKMTVTDDKKQTRERDITMATKLYDGGKTEKRIYRFLSPADVQGTSVLVFDYEAKADDVWIYLPALRKTRRIVSSQKSQSFSRRVRSVVASSLVATTIIGFSPRLPLKASSSPLITSNERTGSPSVKSLVSIR